MSTKLMALNNQTALLKIVDNIVYFSIDAATTTDANTTNTAFNTSALTVIGMVISMTPQVNDNGQVTLSVRPTITRLNGFPTIRTPACAAPRLPPPTAASA